jgi:6-phosphofructo-2-kinase
LLPEGENAAPLEVIGTTASDKLVIIMVGLPATGKLLLSSSFSSVSERTPSTYRQLLPISEYLNSQFLSIQRFSYFL